MDHLIPLEEKIYTFFKDELLFSAQEVRRKFPDENEKAVYRAIQKLEDQQRIRFAHWASRRKVYTTSGVSGLPVFRMGDGTNHPVSALLKNVATIHEGGRFVALEQLEDYALMFCRLFVIAEIEDEKERQKQFKVVHQNLMDKRELLLRLASNIDALIKHPSMQGDMEVFNKIFADPQDKAVPTTEELTEFKRWYSQTFRKAE